MSSIDSWNLVGSLQQTKLINRENDFRVIIVQSFLENLLTMSGFHWLSYNTFIIRLMSSRSLQANYKVLLFCFCFAQVPIPFNQLRVWFAQLFKYYHTDPKINDPLGGLRIFARVCDMCKNRESPNRPNHIKNLYKHAYIWHLLRYLLMQPAACCLTWFRVSYTRPVSIAAA